MNTLILFFIGMIAGFAVSRIQKSQIQGVNADIALGMMGALLIGGFMMQFTEFAPIIVLVSIVGAVALIELGRAMPQPR